MAFNKNLVDNLTVAYNSALMSGNKSAAIASFSAIIGLALSVANDRQATYLYSLLTAVTATDPKNLANDFNSVITMMRNTH